MRLWGRMPDETDQWIRCKWFAIRGRCEDRLNLEYSRYGGRGICLSDEFHDPITFIDYVRSLERGDDAFRLGLEIDRINNDGNYERGNLRWATRQEQNINKENSIYVVYQGKRMHLSEFVRRYCTVTYGAARTLYRNGRSLDEIARTRGRGPRVRRGERWA